MHSNIVSLQAPTCLCARPCPGAMWRTPRALRCRPPLRRCPRCQCIQSSRCRPTVAGPLSPAVMRISIFSFECSSRPSITLQPLFTLLDPGRCGEHQETRHAARVVTCRNHHRGSCCIEDAYLSQIVITARWRRCEDHIGESVTRSSALCPRPDTQASQSADSGRCVHSTPRLLAAKSEVGLLHASFRWSDSHIQRDAASLVTPSPWRQAST